MSAVLPIRCSACTHISRRRQRAGRRFFRRQYVLHYPLEPPYLDKQRAARALAENSGAMAQRALQAGIVVSVRKITANLKTFRELACSTQSVQRTP